MSLGSLLQPILKRSKRCMQRMERGKSKSDLAWRPAGLAQYAISERQIGLSASIDFIREKETRRYQKKKRRIMTMFPANSGLIRCLVPHGKAS